MFVINLGVVINHHGAKVKLKVGYKHGQKTFCESGVPTLVGLVSGTVHSQRDIL